MNARADSIGMVALDLDGTLIDSAPDLADAVNRTLAGIGLPALAAARIVDMIGGGIHTLVERALAASLGRPPAPEQLDAAAAQTVAHYRDALFVLSRVYPGVHEGLVALREQRLTLCCVTNKTSKLTVPLLAASGLATYFDHILCADTPAERKPQPVLLQRACAASGVAPRHALMIGDSAVDIAAARAAGTWVAAVSYGYNPVDKLRELNPDWLITSLTEASGLISPDAP